MEGPLRHPRHPLVLDGIVGAGFAVIGQLELVIAADDGYHAGPMLLNVPLVFLMTAPLAIRRILPLTTAGIMFGAVIVPSLFVAHTLLFWGGLLSLGVALYSVARHGVGWSRKFGWVLAPVALAAYDLRMPPARSLSNTAFALSLFGIAWVLGWALRRYADQRVALAAALEQLVAGQREHERSVVLAERSRIARELHDVVAHAVTTMVVQIGSTRMQLPTSAAAASEELLAVEDVGRAALNEMRAMLGVLRQPGELAETSPAPGVAQLDALADQFRQVGLTLTMHVDDDVAHLAAGLQLTVFRIVQESLTNVLRHAGPVAATVLVSADRDKLSIAITNEPGDGRTAPAAPVAGGHGLLGMRERAGMFGGSLVTGPRPGNGYEVLVSIPLRNAAP